MIPNTEISVAFIENCNRFSYAKSTNIFQQKKKNFNQQSVHGCCQSTTDLE